ncbi:MAG: dTMP kinase [bacterium]|nr:dTMP kinase [bacterium]
MESKYIVFDGMDGSGKGTQLKLLREKFDQSQAVFTREPGGTPFAEEIRTLVCDNPRAGESTALNNFLLFWAAREDLQHNLIVPALLSKKHVFSDRGDSSTFAFQLWGEEHHEFFDLFMDMRQLVFAEDRGRRQPDLYIMFDLPAHVARERALRDARRAQTHFDVRDVGYYDRVRNGFHKFAERLTQQVAFVDATKPREVVHRAVLEILVAQRVVKRSVLA